MKRRTSQIIMGSTLTLAAIAVAIDHTRHPVPEATGRYQSDQAGNLNDETPCGLGANPCGLGGTPCGLGAGTDDED